MLGVPERHTQSSWLHERHTLMEGHGCCERQDIHVSPTHRPHVPRAAACLCDCLNLMQTEFINVGRLALQSPSFSNLV